MVFAKYLRNGATTYSSHQGMDEDTVVRLLTELGCTDIVMISQDEYNQATQVI